MNRSLDILFAALLLAICFLPLVCVGIAIKLTSRGPVLHWSKRAGRKNAIFYMPKFRTMYVDTPQLATHLLPDATHWTTPVGALLRKTSIDELPQLWSILVGQMSFIGPRPALFNQYDLMEQRSARGIDELLPGLTGWAQINGRDNLSIAQKVDLDEYYLKHRSLRLDALIALRSFVKVARREDIASTGPTTASVAGRRAA
jgi:O-antigen biosynthesis protein WbqP